MLARYDHVYIPTPPREAEIDERFLTDSGRSYLSEARQVIDFVTGQPSLGLSRGGFITDPTEQHVQGPEFDLKGVATSLAWLDSGQAGFLGSPTAKSAIGSYEGKHIAERWGRATGFTPYVSNGDFIAAMIWRHVRHKKDGGRSPNCRFALKLLKHARDWHRESYRR